MSGGKPREHAMKDKHCSFPGCDNDHKSKGLCAAHYQQQRKGKPLKPLRKSNRGMCGFNGCTRQHYSLGLCGAHYRQQQKGKDLAPLKGTVTYPCIVDGCDRENKMPGFMCKPHKRQQRRGEEIRPLRKDHGRMPEEEARARVEELTGGRFKPLDPYTNALTPWRGWCLDCDRGTSPRFNDIQQGQGFCTHFGADVAIKRMRDAQVEPLEPFPGSDKKWKCHCQLCDQVIYPRHNNVKKGQEPCTCRSNYGIDYLAPGYFYIVTSDVYVKCGIANEHRIDGRLREHDEDFGPIKVEAKVPFQTTADARLLELEWIEFVKSSPLRVGTKLEYVHFHDEAVTFALTLVRGHESRDVA